MVFGLGCIVRSIAFRILTMVVHSGLVQQQFSMADVKAALEALEKGDIIAGDMCTQSLDAGENTAAQRALTNVADAVGSSADAAVCGQRGSEERIDYNLLGTDLQRVHLFEKADRRMSALRAERAGAAGAVVSLQAAPAASRTVPSEALLGFSPGAAR